MDTKVKAALEGLFNTFSALEGVSAQKELSLLQDLFNSQLDFMSKVDAMDKIFEDSQQLDAIKELTFDLLLINFFSEDSKTLDENYLESPEWEKIEDETIDRGTELLNLLLYLKECEDEQ